jgi:acyl-CoA thioesterase FadM
MPGTRICPGPKQPETSNAILSHVLLFFRFLIATILGRLRPGIDVLGTSTTTFTVLPTDCDLNFHLNAGRTVSFMDVARMDLLSRTRLIGPLLKRRWRPVMGGIVVRYRRSILPFDRFNIRSRIAGWDAKWFYVEHIVEKGGAFCAHAYVRTLVQTRDRNATPAEVLALVGSEELSSPPLPEFVLAWRDAEDRR